MLATEYLVWILLAAPLMAVAGISLTASKRPNLAAAWSIAAILVSCTVTLKLFFLVQSGVTVLVPGRIWFSAGPLIIEWGATVDRLSTLMALIVTGVGGAIQVYSLGYMRGDPGVPRYYAYMSLFTFSMLGIVLAANFAQMFMFWELVGVSSYLLIGFWYERPAAAAAGRKAFLVNRIGDAGMLAGIFILWSVGGSLDFTTLAQGWPVSGVGPALMAAAAGLVFCGAAGKSAQLPLHVWLPDAMEGPTPVSALIHAATMVAAGVYMVCRVHWLMAASPVVMQGIAWIGGITALMAALVAVTQTDIKRVLAYSTLSQLGYMMMAAGLDGSTQAMFHLSTHACFKALLFLAAGSVILALHHQQDIMKMGGLWKRLPLTAFTFLVGTLALGGIWPLSGFYSKDDILILALHQNRALFAIGLVSALLTAFYMGRLFLLVFLGSPRDRDLAQHARESSAVVTVPLVLLAVLSIMAGWNSGIPHLLDPAWGETAHAPRLVAGLLAIPLIGFLLSWLLYGRAPSGDAVVQRLLGPGYRAMQRKFYFDEAYEVVVRIVLVSAAGVADFIERWVIRGAGVGCLTGGAWLLGAIVWMLQSGSLRFYAFTASAGAMILLYWWLIG